MNPLPISRATNSFDLLEELKAVIREEPQRLYMSYWISKSRGIAHVRDKIARNLRPACGTVACCKGWLGILRNPSAAFGDSLGFVWDAFPNSLTHQLYDLFYTFPECRDDASLDPGTPEYVEDIVARIDQIQQGNESELKAFTLVPPSEAA